MNDRPWWVAWCWDAAILLVGTILTLKGNDSAQHVGEAILGGVAIGVYASRKPGGGGPPGSAPTVPIDPGAVMTVFGGAASWLAGHARGAHV